MYYPMYYPSIIGNVYRHVRVSVWTPGGGLKVLFGMVGSLS